VLGPGATKRHAILVNSHVFTLRRSRVKAGRAFLTKCAHKSAEQSDTVPNSRSILSLAAAGWHCQN
ncbi:MAG: hypothetical protein WA772_10575, partial [Candidatus Acidiferrales bacterium]